MNDLDHGLTVWTRDSNGNMTGEWRYVTDGEALLSLLTDPCPNCGGDGNGHDRIVVCPSCGGRGWTAKPELVERVADLLYDRYGIGESRPWVSRNAARAVLLSMLEEQ